MSFCIHVFSAIRDKFNWEECLSLSMSVSVYLAMFCEEET